VCPHQELNAYLETLEGKASGGTIKNYIRDILALTEKVQKQFFRKIQFELEVDDIT
jgi:hypothetical protein